MATEVWEKYPIIRYERFFDLQLAISHNVPRDLSLRKRLALSLMSCHTVYYYPPLLLLPLWFSSHCLYPTSGHIMMGIEGRGGAMKLGLVGKWRGGGGGWVQARDSFREIGR